MANKLVCVNCVIGLLATVTLIAGVVWLVLCQCTPAIVLVSVAVAVLTVSLLVWLVYYNPSYWRETILGVIPPDSPDP